MNVEHSERAPMRYGFVVLAMLLACGGGSEDPPPDPASPGAPRAAGTSTPGASGTPAPGSPAAPRPIHGRRLYVDNTQDTPVSIVLGAVRREVGAWQLAKLAPPEGEHVLDGVRFEISRSSDQLLVYNPGKAGRYVVIEKVYGSDEPEPDKTVETITGELVFARRAHFGPGEVFPFVVRDEPYQRKLAKEWGPIAGLEQALGAIATGHAMIDGRGGELVGRAFAELEAHPDDPRVWQLVLAGLTGLQASRHEEVIVLARHAKDPVATRAAIEALPASGARTSLLARMDARDRAPREKLAAQGDLGALLEMPELIDRHAKALDGVLGKGPMTAEDLAAVRKRFETADARDKEHLASYFLKVYRGDLSPLAAWAYCDARLSSRALTWFSQAATAGDVDAVLAVLAVKGADGRSGTDPAVRRVVAIVATGEPVEPARRAASALIALADAAPEAERAALVYELSSALNPHTKGRAGARATAVLLGAFAAKLLDAHDAQTRGDAGAIIANVVQHTRDKALVERLARAAKDETDPATKATLEQRARYLASVVGG